MCRYQVALFVTLTLVLQLHQTVANDCKRRSTFIQIRIPQRTNVAIKYPKEINPVQSVKFVPFPYNPAGSECIKCQEKTCSKCTYIKKSHSVTMENARKTNIIIDIKGTRQFNESISQPTSEVNDSNSTSVDGTIVAIYDKTTAVSKSGAKAEAGKEGKSAAAVASGTTLSQSDVLAAISDEVVNKENGQKISLEDIYVLSEGLSTAEANSSAASEDNTKTDATQPSTDDSKETSNGLSPADKTSDKDVNTGAISPPSSDATSAIGKTSAEPEQSAVVISSDSSSAATTTVDKKETTVDAGTATEAKVDN